MNKLTVLVLSRAVSGVHLLSCKSLTHLLNSGSGPSNKKWFRCEGDRVSFFRQSLLTYRDFDVLIRNSAATHISRRTDLLDCGCWVTASKTLKSSLEGEM